MLFLAGISAGVINAVVTNSLDTMKVRVQIKVGAGTSALDCVCKMAQQEGLAGLGKVLAPAMLFSWQRPVSALPGECCQVVIHVSLSDQARASVSAPCE